MAPKMLAISGVKNSGKTTLIERLIPYLNDAGVRVAVIKHDGHSFTPDTPGTDSYRFFDAGAYGTAVFDDEKFSISRRGGVDEAELIKLFPDTELILLEGFKNSDYAKIEIVRKGVSEHPICDPNTVIAMVTDLQINVAVPLISSEDILAIVKIVLKFLRN